jgi:hypothetical protein
MLMPLRFGKTGETDLDSLRVLFDKAFGPDAREPLPALTDEDMLEWKYWSARPDWDGSRSYSLSSGSEFLAHAAVLPLMYEGCGAPVSAQHFIDWAAEPVSIASGAKLLRRLIELSDVTLAIGGSQDTRKLLPLLKFKPVGKVRTLARPLRAWTQFRTHQYRNWKLPARLARNAWWSRTASMRVPSGWDCKSVEPNSVPCHIWIASGEPGALWRKRSPEVISYYLRCPAVKFRLFLARENSSPQGAFVLAITNGVARIADLWLINASEERYERVYRLAVAASYEFEEVAEVSAYSSIASRTAALRRCGFRSQRESQLMAFSRVDLPIRTFDCQMIDNDAAFLHGESPAYLT